MRRTFLFAILAVLFFALGLWWYRKVAAEAALASVLAFLSPTEVAFKIDSLDSSGIKFDYFGMPAEGVSLSATTLNIKSVLSSGRAIELESKEIEIDLRKKAQGPKGEANSESAFTLIEQLKGLPLGSLSILKSPVRFISESGSRTGSVSAFAQKSSAGLKSRLDLTGDLPFKVSFDLSSEFSEKPQQIFTGQAAFSIEDPEFSFDGPIMLEQGQQAKRLTLGEQAKLVFQNAALSLKAMLKTPWLLTQGVTSNSLNFVDTNLDISGSSFNSPAFYVNCDACRLVLKKGSFTSSGWEVRAALEIDKAQTALSVEGRPDPIGKVFLEGSMQSSADRFTYKIGKLDAALFGGRLTLSPDGSAPLKANCSSIAFKIEDIEIPHIMALYSTSRVSASGTLSGVVPLLFCKDGWHIEQANLSSAAGGNIKLSAPMQTGVEQVDKAFEALRDFDYSKLNAVMSMQTDGKLDIKLNIEGISKSLGKNAPLVLNLNVEENLWMLLKSLRIAQQVSEQFSGVRAD